MALIVDWWLHGTCDCTISNQKQQESEPEPGPGSGWLKVNSRLLFALVFCCCGLRAWCMCIVSAQIEEA
jgi:hypothetical protein